MAKILEDVSRTFSEFLLIPGETKKENIVDNVSVSTIITRYTKETKDSAIKINVPLVSAVMQSVSNDTLAIALASQGGLSFIFGAQTIQQQAEMVRKVKEAKVEDGNPNALLDKNNRYMVGCGINSRDYKERVPELIKAGCDILCIDSSEGYSIWQKETIAWVKETYGDTVKIGAGNVVEGDGFKYLADAGADFVKIGIGGGSICITRETKGIGRGQASAVLAVSKARDEYYKETGIYVPICSDGGIVFDHHITLALAMGADFVMLGRYFARFTESPTPIVQIDGKPMKEYWGEGSNRARNWQRYDMGGEKKLTFEEGVDSYVPYVGDLKDNLLITIKKIKSTMCNCGVLNIKELQDNAVLTIISPTSIVEGGAHDVVVRK